MLARSNRLLRRALLGAAILSAGCAPRTLTETEIAFSDSVMGSALNTSSVRIVNGAVVGLLSATYNPRPRTTCRERLRPPRSEPVRGYFAAFVLGETVYYSRRTWQEDFLSEYPAEMELREAMRLAHELTHVWQWQNRAVTGYHPFKAAREHIERDDPYLIEIDENRPFLDYSYEQQGILVEEFVCCRALDPDGLRTEQLARVVAQVFPDAAPAEVVARPGITLAWSEAETEGICS